MCDHIEFANIIVLTNLENTDEKRISEIKSVLKEFNANATVLKAFELKQLVNTGKFNFEEMEANVKWLEKQEISQNENKEGV